MTSYCTACEAPLIDRADMAQDDQGRLICRDCEEKYEIADEEAENERFIGL